MAESDLQQLAQALTEDADLKAAVEGATSPEDVVRIANDKGIALTLDDLTPKIGELSEAELETVSGGTAVFLSFRDCVNPLSMCRVPGC